MLDSGLAELYRVTTARPNEQVRRNRERFPKDFSSRRFLEVFLCMVTIEHGLKLILFGSKELFRLVKLLSIILSPLE